MNFVAFVLLPLLWLAATLTTARGTANTATSGGNNVTVLLDAYSLTSTLTDNPSTLPLGTTVILICRTVGIPQGTDYNYTWSCPGLGSSCNIGQGGNSNRMTYGNRLLLNIFSPSDAGMYICKVDLGTQDTVEMAVFQLNVEGGLVVSVMNDRIPNNTLQAFINAAQISPDRFLSISCSAFERQPMWRGPNGETVQSTAERDPLHQTIGTNSAQLRINQFTPGKFVCSDSQYMSSINMLDEEAATTMPPELLSMPNGSHVVLEPQLHSADRFIFSFARLDLNLPGGMLISEYQEVVNGGNTATVKPRAVPGVRYEVYLWAVTGTNFSEIQKPQEESLLSGKASSPPRSLTVTRTFPGGLELNWIPPKEPNGEIMGYEIQYGMDTVDYSTVNTDRRDTYYNLTGLQNTTYYIRVVAENDVKYKTEGTWLLFTDFEPPRSRFSSSEVTTVDTIITMSAAATQSNLPTPSTPLIQSMSPIRSTLPIQSASPFQSTSIIQSISLIQSSMPVQNTSLIQNTAAPIQQTTPIQITSLIRSVSPVQSTMSVQTTSQIQSTAHTKDSAFTQSTSSLQSTVTSQSAGTDSAGTTPIATTSINDTSMPEQPNTADTSIIGAVVAVAVGIVACAICIAVVLMVLGLTWRRRKAADREDFYIVNDFGTLQTRPAYQTSGFSHASNDSNQDEAQMSSRLDENYCTADVPEADNSAEKETKKNEVPHSSAEENTCPKLSSRMQLDDATQSEQHMQTHKVVCERENTEPENTCTVLTWSEIEASMANPLGSDEDSVPDPSHTKSSTTDLSLPNDKPSREDESTTSKEKLGGPHYSRPWKSKVASLATNDGFFIQQKKPAPESDSTSEDDTGHTKAMTGKLVHAQPSVNAEKECQADDNSVTQPQAKTEDENAISFEETLKTNTDSRSSTPVKTTDTQGEVPSDRQHTQADKDSTTNSPNSEEVLPSQPREPTVGATDNN